MDLQLTPSNLNLTSRLVRITSAGANTEQVLDSQTLWHYLVTQCWFNAIVIHPPHLTQSLTCDSAH